MKYILFLFALAGSSCQRMVLVYTPGMEVKVQKNQVTVIDSTHQVRHYFYKGAYQALKPAGRIQYLNVFRLLHEVRDSKADLGFLHGQSTKKYMRKYDRFLKNESLTSN